MLFSCYVEEEPAIGSSLLVGRSLLSGKEPMFIRKDNFCKGRGPGEDWPYPGR